MQWKQLWKPLSKDASSFPLHSYGFRLKKGAHKALKQAEVYVNEGYKYVVDLDLEKFFDRVNRDILMNLIPFDITSHKPNEKKHA